jgi:hypothetical protein
MDMGDTALCRTDQRQEIFPVTGLKIFSNFFFLWAHCFEMELFAVFIHITFTPVKKTLSHFSLSGGEGARIAF